MATQLTHGVDELSGLKATGVTIGNFDGVHKGHQALIARTLSRCHEEGLEPVLLTFWPHPRLVVTPRKRHTPLTDHARRLELLEEMGVPRVLELPFTPDLARLSPQEFVRDFLLPLRMRLLVLGHDFTLGRDRGGTVEVLRALGEEWHFRVEQLAPVRVHGDVVSSTRLRNLIQEGAVERAAPFLGRFYDFSGQVVHGAGRGNALGFPTANLLPPETLLPATGVYATRVLLGLRRFQAVTNIGYKPTFAGKDLTVESFLLDARENLYGQRIRLEFVARLRGEQRFAGPEELSRQIERDVRAAREILEGLDKKPL